MAKRAWCSVTRLIEASADEYSRQKQEEIRDEFGYQPPAAMDWSGGARR